MQIYRKTRQGFLSSLIRPLIKIGLLGVVILVIIFIVGNLNLPAPNKIIKQKISNENFKVIK